MKIIMKKGLILALSTIVILAACNKSVDKKAELAELKSQKTELEAKIKVIETELGKTSVDTKEAERVINVAVSPILAQNFKHFVEVQGLVESENIVQVTPQMGGAITGIFVQEGQIVKKGQLVATIDNQMVKESINEIKNQLDLANVVFQKQKALWDQQIGTEIQYLQAKNNKEALEKRITSIETQLGMSRVYAPISGTVEIVRQKQGEMGMPGSPMMQIVNLLNLKATGKVPDIYLASVKKGQSITITFPDLKKEINGRLSNVNALVDPVSRTFGVESKIPNVGNLLKPNQIAIIKINDLAKSNSIVIDQNLIQKTELGDIVYVAIEEGGKKKAQGRKVKTGINYNGQIEIVEGLKIGDNLISTGYQELVDGTPLAY
jgi:membrane fusion protein, multidrug efflux system